MVKKESIPTLTLEIEAEDIRKTFGNLGHTVVDLSANSPDINYIKKLLKLLILYYFRLYLKNTALITV